MIIKKQAHHRVSAVLVNVLIVRVTRMSLAKGENLLKDMIPTRMVLAKGGNLFLEAKAEQYLLQF